MTAASVQWIEGENIIVETFPSDFQPSQDVADTARRGMLALNQAAMPVPYIVDLRLLTVDFGTLTTALAEFTRGANAHYRHRNLKEMCVVTQNPLLKMGAKALKQDQYGEIKTHIFETMDEAVDYARSIAPAAAH